MSGYLRGKVSNITCLFALDMILLVCVLNRLKKGDIFAERQQRDEAENTARVRPSLSGTGGIKAPLSVRLWTKQTWQEEAI